MAVNYLVMACNIQFKAILNWKPATYQPWIPPRVWRQKVEGVVQEWCDGFQEIIPNLQGKERSKMC